MKWQLWKTRINTMVKAMIVILIIGFIAYSMFIPLPENSYLDPIEELREIVEELKLEKELEELLEVLKKIETKEPPYIEDVWIRIKNHKVEV